MHGRTISPLVRRSRLWRIFQLAGIGLMCAMAVIAVRAGSADAATGCGTLPSGTTVYINCVAPPTSTPLTTYIDDQQIDLAMGPNSIFSPSDTNAGSIEAIECAYVNDALPTSAASCDARSGAGDFPFPVRADGSWDYEAQNTGDQATVFSFPDQTFTSSAIQCDATNACVWYVGENYNDFTQPKVFSAPFFVTPPVSTTTTTSPTGTTTTSASATTTTTSSSPTPTTSASATTTTSPTDTTTTSAGTASTTSTTAACATTATTSGGDACTATATAAGGGGDSGPDATGTSAAEVDASSGSLAFTGTPPFLPWLLGLGVMLLAIGSVGRRASLVRHR